MSRGYISLDYFFGTKSSTINQHSSIMVLFFLASMLSIVITEAQNSLQVNNEFAENEKGILHLQALGITSAIRAPLARAVVEGDLQKVRALLEQGESCFCEYQPGRSPFIVALYMGNIECLEEFSNHDSFEGLLPHAVHSLYPYKVILYLLNKGVRPTIRADGSTVLHLLSERSLSTASYLASSFGQRFSLYKRDLTKCVKKLVDAGVDIEATTNDGLTALHLASLYKTPEMVSALLRSGASVNAKDSANQTPLNYAVMPLPVLDILDGEIGCAERAQPDICTILLMHAGADAARRANNNELVFQSYLQNSMICAIITEQRFLQALKYLLGNGAPMQDLNSLFQKQRYVFIKVGLKHQSRWSDEDWGWLTSYVQMSYCYFMPSAEEMHESFQRVRQVLWFIKGMYIQKCDEQIYQPRFDGLKNNYLQSKILLEDFHEKGNGMYLAIVLLANLKCGNPVASVHLTQAKEVLVDYLYARLCEIDLNVWKPIFRKNSELIKDLVRQGINQRIIGLKKASFVRVASSKN